MIQLKMIPEDFPHVITSNSCRIEAKPSEASSEVAKQYEPFRQATASRPFESAKKTVQVEKSKPLHDDRSKLLAPLDQGDLVIVQDSRSKQWRNEGIIHEVRRSGRTYVVIINGKKLFRNRKFLRPIASVVDEDSEVESTDLAGGDGVCSTHL